MVSCQVEGWDEMLSSSLLHIIVLLCSCASDTGGTYYAMLGRVVLVGLL